MKNNNLLVTMALTLFSATACLAQDEQNGRQLTLQTNKLGADIAPTMYGIFFEDINYGADGGLYAEMVKNRSFEFPQSFMGWKTIGKVSLATESPAFERNPHYVTLLAPGHREKRTCIENEGFFGMGLKDGMKYNFSVYARIHGSGSKASLRVDLINSKNAIVETKKIDITGTEWKKYTVDFTSNVTDAHGKLRLFHQSGDGIDIDHVSMFPADSWNGLRVDLVKALEDLHPGVFRFPGGCIVEGTDLSTRYQWKNSVGDVENRPLNENRWNYTFQHRLSPDYYQSYGLGFYEFFLLSEKIGSEPLPILSVGLACQFQNDDNAKGVHVSVDDLQPYIQDALDLIEFANGGTDTKWGALRAKMGHPASFNLKYIGIGNEQWGPLYPERLEPFLKAIRKAYPDIKVVGSAGPSASGDKFDYGWKEMRRLKADLVDEHYYMAPDWFLSNAARYDNYDRKGPKVFAGEYACHAKHQPNSFEAALCEAAFMTGIERNADVVRMATYAPLFAHVDGWQWRPDLIWFDNLQSMRTPSYYVQQLYGTHRGTNVLKLTENGKALTGQDGLYASAVIDKTSGKYIVKIVNTADKAQSVTINFHGVKTLAAGKLTTLHADLKAENKVGEKSVVVPVESEAPSVEASKVALSIPAATFAVYEWSSEN